MKILLLLLVIVPLVAAAQKESPEEMAIHNQVQKLAVGWNTGSGKKFAEPFAEYADYVVINGMHITGREAIDKAHQQIFDTIYKGTRLEIKVEKWRMLSRDVAVVIAAAKRDNLDKSIDRARMTIVFSRSDGKWLIESFQNTAIQAPPSK